jgi:hypothetical protein
MSVKNRSDMQPLTVKWLEIVFRRKLSCPNIKNEFVISVLPFSDASSRGESLLHQVIYFLKVFFKWKWNVKGLTLKTSMLRRNYNEILN